MRRSKCSRVVAVPRSRRAERNGRFSPRRKGPARAFRAERNRPAARGRETERENDREESLVRSFALDLRTWLSEHERLSPVRFGMRPLPRPASRRVAKARRPSYPPSSLSSRGSTLAEQSVPTSSRPDRSRALARSLARS